MLQYISGYTQTRLFYNSPRRCDAAWRRRRNRASRGPVVPGRAGPGRAGPGRNFCYSSQRRRSCIAKRRRRRASIAALPPVQSLAVPCAEEWNQRGRRRARGKLSKVDTWFAQWCAGGRKGYFQSLPVKLQTKGKGLR